MNLRSSYYQLKYILIYIKHYKSSLCINLTRDITIDNLVGILREGKLEGEAEFIGHVSVFSGARATSLFLEHYETGVNDKLFLISLDNKKYQIFSEDRESCSPDRKKQFKLNFQIKDDTVDFDLRDGSI